MNPKQDRLKAGSLLLCRLPRSRLISSKRATVRNDVLKNSGMHTLHNLADGHCSGCSVVLQEAAGVSTFHPTLFTNQHFVAFDELAVSVIAVSDTRKCRGQRGGGSRFLAASVRCSWPLPGRRGSPQLVHDQHNACGCSAVHGSGVRESFAAAQIAASCLRSPVPRSISAPSGLCSLQSPLLPTHPNR